MATEQAFHAIASWLRRVHDITVEEPIVDQGWSANEAGRRNNYDATERKCHYLCYL